MPALLNRQSRQLSLLSLLTFACSLHVHAQRFTVFSNSESASIVYDSKGPALDSISAYLLSDDIRKVSGTAPQVFADLSKATGNVIIIGNIHSDLVSSLSPGPTSWKDSLSGKWERYGYKTLKNPAKNIAQAFIVAGSDARGTAYGVLSLSEQMGVSPWNWWADVPVKPRKEISFETSDYFSESPSVKYRGIFLNDEDWGLQPWAAKTFEPETGDIGPRTYARIFELLLRLKANLIWPAMHPSTKAFYHYPGNKKVAQNYSILVGSSHAEPMLRNNVDEWKKDMGAFNYITNKNTVHQYWESRVKESADHDAIYTLGMRGVHDSGMEGVKSIKETVPLLETIIKDQRDLLSKYVNTDLTKIPQAFTAYKEVLEIYDHGLQLPEDVVLVWPDDNYGYIHRLNNEAEKSRAGGSGVYYHASYWGRPHDYLWLSTTHPALIREEMMKAYDNKSDRLWVLNVGDIKPQEYAIQLFMDMAYNATPFKQNNYAGIHHHQWLEKIFGSETSADISRIMWKYYDLAFERKPEFMGWSRTEPTTQTQRTEYNHFFYGDEAQRRIDSYSSLEKEARNLKTRMDASAADAYYQLVYYPVVGASLMNKKFLYLDKSYLYSRQHRLSAFSYFRKSEEAFQAITKETNFFNTQLSGGKWKHMMSMEPRSLPVYLNPTPPQISIDSSRIWGLSTEGDTPADTLQSGLGLNKHSLPNFSKPGTDKFFIDLFLRARKDLNWTIKSYPKWIRISQTKGILRPESGNEEVRIWVEADWSKIRKGQSTSGEIVFAAAGKTVKVEVTARDFSHSLPKNYVGFTGGKGYISLPAKAYSRKTTVNSAFWQDIEAPGPADTFLRAMPLIKQDIPLDNIRQTAPVLEYDFFTFTGTTPTVHVHTLPTHPLNNDSRMRYAVCVDDGPLQVLDHTTVGRSEEWKQNVLRNSAIRVIKTQFLEKGPHKLKIYMIDPAVVLQHITIDLGNLKPSYGWIPET